MKFTADTADLARAVRATKKVSPRNPSWPLLSGFKVEALDGICAITATDMETGRRVEFEAKVEEPGAALMPPRFPSVVTAATAEVVTVSDGIVTSGRSRWQLEPLDLDGYPAEPSPEGDAVTMTDWSRIQAVATATSVDGSRPILAGVCFDEGFAAATDSYRLAWTETETPDFPMNIPARAIGALTEAPKTAVCDGRVIKAATEDGAWWSRLIDGAFPKWQSLIPKTEAATVITVRTELLADVISRARLVLEEGWPIFVETGTGELVVKSGKYGGRFSEAIEAKVEGDDIIVAYNPAFLVVMTAPVDEVSISLIDNLKPARIQGGDGQWWNAMLMGVRT